MTHFCLLPRVVRGRVPKAWFDIWGLRPGRCFNLENYDVALPGYGIGGNSCTRFEHLWHGHGRTQPRRMIFQRGNCLLCA
jgi:hypothetical protein